MKSLNTIAACAASVLLIMGAASCDNGKTRMQSQIDSLATADSLHQEDVKQMADFINVMSVGLDSIAAQEGQIRAQSREGASLDKAQLRSQLDNLGNLLKTQRERIEALEAEVKDNESAYGKRIKKLIAYYKAQLDEKDKQIAELQKQLSDKDANIQELNKNVASLTSTNAQLNETVESQAATVEKQENTINEQDATIHTAFVLIGTTKVLKEKGIIKGGFLSKKKIVVSNMQANQFEKVDIRNFNDITLRSKDPQIMTQMPSDSYTLKQNGDGTTTLHITNTSTFWSVSKYLVVRL